jgi:uncharacterized protein YodC (DUF2158 family)
MPPAADDYFFCTFANSPSLIASSDAIEYTHVSPSEGNPRSACAAMMIPKWTTSADRGARCLFNTRGGKKMPDLRVGDVVQLKSGGPKMTVASTKSNAAGILCTWFDGNEVKSSRFPAEALSGSKAAPPKKPTARVPKRRLPLDAVD